MPVPVQGVYHIGPVMLRQNCRSGEAARCEQMGDSQRKLQVEEFESAAETAEPVPP